MKRSLLHAFPWPRSPLNSPEHWPRLLRDRVDQTGTGTRRDLTVLLARSRCRLKWFGLSTVPPSERRAAARMQAEAWSPFERGGYQFAVVGDQGMVVAWDRDAVDADLRTAGLDPERCALVPEPLMRKPDEDGVVLVESVEGLEGQFWRDGVLCASRWWLGLPGDQEWLLFLHACGAPLTGATTPPAPRTLPWLGSPWVRLHGPGAMTMGVSSGEHRLVQIGALAITFASGFVAHQAFDVWSQTRASEQAIAALRAGSTQVLAERDKAVRQASQLQRWVHWFEEPLPIEVITQLHEQLAQSGVQIRELDLAGSKLSLGLQLGPNTQRSDVVRRLRASGWFKDVAESRTENARGLMLIDLTLDGLRPPAKAEPLGKPASAGGAPAIPDPFGGKS